MIFKCLAAAGLAASLATGGAVAVHSSSDTPPATEVSAGAATGNPVTGTTGLDAAGDDHAEAGEHPDGDDHGLDDETTASTTVNTPAAAPTITVFPAGDAGTVTLSVIGGRVTVAAVAPNAGWTVETERGEGHEARVTFRNGLRHIDFKAEFEDGRLVTRVRDRLEGERHDEPAASTPPTTTDDNPVAGDDDNHPEVEIEHETEDHSGSGDSSDSSGSRDGGDHSGRDGGDHSGSGHDGSDG